MPVFAFDLVARYRRGVNYHRQLAVPFFDTCDPLGKKYVPLPPTNKNNDRNYPNLVFLPFSQVIVNAII